ncbi:MAG: hypothetical protein FWF91_01135 [Coriobacteriia bacterium]|nr:hypothetical protein [Coriobacteriia bacterium]
MKKAFVLTVAILLALSSLIACGSGNPESKYTTTAPPIDINRPFSFVQRTVEVPEEILDLEDAGIYFIIIDGVRFDLADATLQDFFDAGFSFCDRVEDVNREIGPRESASDEYYFNLTKGNSLFQTIAVYVENLADEPLPLKDCRVTAIHVSIHSMYGHVCSTCLDISLVCNLGFTWLGENDNGENEFSVVYAEDVFSVFGDSYPTHPNYVFVDNGKEGQESRSFIFTRGDVDTFNVHAVTIRYGGEHYINQGEYLERAISE